MRKVILKEYCPPEIANQTIECYMVDFAYDQCMVRQNPPLFYFIQMSHIVVKEDGSLYKAINPSKDLLDNLNALKDIEEKFRVEEIESLLTSDSLNISLTGKQREIIRNSIEYELEIGVGEFEEDVEREMREILEKLK